MKKVEVSAEDVRILAQMITNPSEFWSAPSLGSNTMVLRSLAERGLVTTRLSNSGLPFYRITGQGKSAALAHW